MGKAVTDESVLQSGVSAHAVHSESIQTLSSFFLHFLLLQPHAEIILINVFPHQSTLNTL